MSVCHNPYHHKQKRILHVFRAYAADAIKTGDYSLYISDRETGRISINHVEDLKKINLVPPITEPFEYKAISDCLEQIGTRRREELRRKDSAR